MKQEASIGLTDYKLARIVAAYRTNSMLCEADRVCIVLTLVRIWLLSFGRCPTRESIHRAVRMTEIRPTLSCVKQAKARALDSVHTCKQRDVCVCVFLLQIALLLSTRSVSVRTTVSPATIFHLSSLPPYWLYKLTGLHTPSSPARVPRL